MLVCMLFYLCCMCMLRILLFSYLFYFILVFPLCFISCVFVIILFFSVPIVLVEFVLFMLCCYVCVYATSFHLRFYLYLLCGVECASACALSIRYVFTVGVSCWYSWVFAAHCVSQRGCVLNYGFILFCLEFAETGSKIQNNTNKK